MQQAERIGRYEIQRVLGRGAAGIVYLARDPLIDREVAVKTLRGGLDQECSEEYRRRFLCEARAAGRLSHPNIVTVYDVGENLAQEDAFIAMEYLDGTTLKQAIASGTRYDAPSAANLAATLANALDYAHRQGVVHRDVKPANVILTDDSGVKIADFGIARLDTSDLTVEGSFLGTPNYMSPEQIRGQPADGRSDLYSVGVILFELVTGRRPFTGKSLPELSLNIANQPIPDPALLSPGLPESLSAIIRRCLAKNPEDRFQTGSELALSLSGIAAGPGPDVSKKVSAPPPLPDPFAPASEATHQTQPLSATPPPLPLAVADTSHTTPPPLPAEASSPSVRRVASARRIVRTWWFWATAGCLALLLAILALIASRDTAPNDATPGQGGPTSSEEVLGPEGDPAGPMPDQDPSPSEAQVSPTPAQSPPSDAAQSTPKATPTRRRRPRPSPTPKPVATPREVAQPTPTATPTPEPTPTPLPAKSTLVVEHRNRLSSGSISLSVDGRQVWSLEMPPLKGIARVKGAKIQESITVAAGEHGITVRINGKKKASVVDESASIVGDFQADQTRHLRVSLKSGGLKLSWETP